MHPMILASADFYRAFEDRFRGPRAEIKERLKVYLPFIQPLQEKCAPAMALDLGCGRGEWLELLTEHGFSAQGVDIDDGMLSACRRRGLNVHTADALAFLKALPGESQALVSGFHIAEHLSFDVLQELVCQALRVLIPGGLLILETPNPENITVGTASFYLDPTHQRPLPPPLLAFLTEFAGFRRQKILRLQESSELLRSGAPITLLQVLSGVSPDYAVVAQKDGPISLISVLGAPFSAEHGVTLDWLAHQYQLQTEALARQNEIEAQLVETKKLQFDARALILEAHVQQAEVRVQQAEVRVQQAEARAQQAEARAQQAEARAQQAEVQTQQVQAEKVLAEQRAQQAESRVMDMLNSNSWKFTAPFRALSGVLRRFFRSGMLTRYMPAQRRSRPRDYQLSFIHWMGRKVQKSAVLRRFVLSVMHRFPSVGIILRRLYNETKFSSQSSSVGRESVHIASSGEIYSPPSQVEGCLDNLLRPRSKQNTKDCSATPLELVFFDYLRK